MANKDQTALLKENEERITKLENVLLGFDTKVTAYFGELKTKKKRSAEGDAPKEEDEIESAIAFFVRQEEADDSGWCYCTRKQAVVLCLEMHWDLLRSRKVTSTGLDPRGNKPEEFEAANKLMWVGRKQEAKRDGEMIPSRIHIDQVIVVDTWY